MSTQIDFSRQIRFPRREVNDVDYVASNDDTYICFKNLTSSRQIILPLHTEYVFARPLMIADESGACSPDTMIIVKNKADTVIGVLRQPKSYLTLVASDAGWIVFGNNIISSQDLSYAEKSQLSVYDKIAGTEDFIGRVDKNLNSFMGDTLEALESIVRELNLKSERKSGIEIPFSDTDTTSISESISGLAVDTLNAIKEVLTLSSSVVTGNSGFTSIPTNSVRYFTHGLVSSEASSVYAPLGKRARLRDLRIIASAAPGEGNTWRFSLQKLFSETFLKCSISGSDNSVGVDFTNFVDFDPDDRWCIKVENTGNAPEISNIGFSFVLQPLEPTSI